MNHNRKINNRINRIHERTLRVVYNDDNATFEQLLEKDNAVKIHDRNLQVLATEMFKVKLGIAPVIVMMFFVFAKMIITHEKQISFSHIVSKQYIMTQKLYLFWALNYGQYFLMNIKVLLI